MTNYTIYALHLSSNEDYRYVGRTSRQTSERLKRHIRDAESGSTHPVHLWMMEAGVANLTYSILEETDDPEREAWWISYLSERGSRLLNVADATTGVGPWSEDQRARFSGENNPFYGRQHTEESRAKMRRSAPRTSGAEHHLTGKKLSPEHAAKIASAQRERWTPEARKAHSEKMREVSANMVRPDTSGENNPFYGRTHTAETRSKMSESAKNRPPISDETRERLRKRNHVRWHLNRGLVKIGCVFCDATL